MDDSQSRKRPRPVVSCLRCREKKLKCDRVTPCENCIKAGCHADCVYHQYPGNVDFLPRAKRVQAYADAVDQTSSCQRNGSCSSGGAGIIESLQQRVAKLEELVSIGPPTVNFGQVKDASVSGHSSPQSSNITTQSAASPNFLGTLVVKGSRSRYHGQNDRVTLLNQFAQAKEFINQCAKDAAIVGLAKEVQFLQRKFQAPLKSPEPVPDSSGSPALLKLHEFLPSKSVCDQLLVIYTNNFEKTLRILHMPSFRRQYSRFWAAPGPETSKLSAFLPQLTAILAVSLTLEDHSIKFDDPSSRTYLKLAALDVVGAWLEELGRKQRTELATLQVETLLLLAQHLRLAPAEKLWSAAGALVRSAMVMGLHLNPSESPKISVLQAECRRRLWMTIVEMDLQASIASGMPFMAPEVDFSSLTPANLNDSDLDESTTELPPPKPLHEWTDSLAQVTLAMSLPQRIKVMALVKSSTPEVDLSEVVKQGRRLEEFLRHIPSPMKLDHALKSQNDPGHLLNRVLVDIYTRRPLLCLYRPLLLGDSHDDSSYPEIQRVCLESSLVILSYQDYFDPYVADLDVFSSNSYWDIFQVFCKNDILWAGLSVCQYIKSSSQQTVQNATESPQSGLYPSQRGLPPSKASLTRIVENTLDALTRRIGEIGSDLKDVLFLAVVLQSVRVRGSTPQKESWMYQGAKKALSACRQHLLPAVVEEPPALTFTDARQTYQTNHPAPVPTSEAHPTPNAQVQPVELLLQPSALATEFNNFQADIFSFGNGTFNIDSNWNFDQFWQ